MTSNRRLLITGVSGLLGSSLSYYFRNRYDILGIFNAHPYNPPWARSERADLTRPEESERIVRSFRPDVCIHCAAMADIDRCETERDAAYKTNVGITRYLAGELAAASCKLIFISTDAVYDGKNGVFTEDAPVRPVNYYGQTKLEAEREAARRADTLIVRTSFFGWGHGHGRLSISEWAFNELSAGRRIRGFKDIRTSSLYVHDLASLLERSLAGGLTGIYNFACSDSISKYELLRTIARLFGLDETLIDPAAADEMSSRTKRSKELTLSSVKLSKALGLQLPTVARGLESFYRDYRSRSRGLCETGRSL